MKRSHHISVQQPSAPRRGGAMVEFAICLPVMMTLVMGSIEASNAIYLRHAAKIAAYEAAQIVSASEGKQASALTRGLEVLTSRNITGGSITFSPNVDSTTAGGTLVKVSVTVPSSSNSIVPALHFSSATLKAEVVMARL